MLEQWIISLRRKDWIIAEPRLPSINLQTGWLKLFLTWALKAVVSCITSCFPFPGREQLQDKCLNALTLMVTMELWKASCPGSWLLAPRSFPQTNSSIFELPNDRLVTQNQPTGPTNSLSWNTWLSPKCSPHLFYLDAAKINIGTLCFGWDLCREGLRSMF